MKNIINILIKGFSDNHEKDYIDVVISMIESKTGMSEDEILEKAYQYCSDKGKNVHDKNTLEWCFVDFDIHEFGDVKPHKRAKDFLNYL
jgi:hypothetical protein